MSELHLTFDCAEDPRRMTPCRPGLFCHACAEPVLDLTTWRREDIIRYLQQHPRTCGQLLPEQLDPTLIPLRDMAAPLRRGSFAALAAIGISTMVQAQTPAEPVVTEQVPPAREPRRVLDMQGHVVEQRDGAWVCPKPEPAPRAKAKHMKKHVYLSRRFPFIEVRGPRRGRVSHGRLIF